MKTFLTLLSLCAMTGLVQASDVHFKGQGPDKTPIFEDMGLYLEAKGELSGLSNLDIRVDITASGTAVSVCTNKGGNMAPGQNPAELELSGSLLIDAESLGKNGTVGFTLRTQDPPNPVQGAPGCSNPNWTQTIVDILFTGLTVTVEQPVGYPALEAVCTFAAPSTNNVITRDAISCTVTQY